MFSAESGRAASPSRRMPTTAWIEMHFTAHQRADDGLHQRQQLGFHAMVEIFQRPGERVEDALDGLDARRKLAQSCLHAGRPPLIEALLPGTLLDRRLVDVAAAPVGAASTGLRHLGRLPGNAGQRRALAADQPRRTHRRRFRA